MMTDKCTVLLVDDDSEQLALHELHVKAQGCEVVTASNGEEALAILKDAPEKFAVILSDILMPEMDGYQFCQAVKSDCEIDSIPLIFVSQLNNLEEILKGYGVGADDYITKPIQPEVLAYKLKRLEDIRQKNSTLDERMVESQQVAMQAMTYSSDLGQVLEFYNKTFKADTFEAVAEFLFEITSAQGLRATLQIISPRQVLNFGDRGEVSPLESNVIELSRKKSRFFHFGCRTVINFDDFSLLIKNMPIDDPERYGITKDTLGTLCNAVEARVQFLMNQSASAHKEQIAGAVMSVLEDLDSAFSEIQRDNVAVISAMMDELDEAMMDLGLSNNQEALVREITVRCSDGSKKVFQKGVNLYEKFEEVRGKLDSILS